MFLKSYVIALTGALIRKLTLFHTWLQPPVVTPPAPMLEVEVSPCLTRTIELVRGMEGLDASGEYKRHQVYARLIKDFPITPKRVLSRTIEDAIDMVREKLGTV